MYIWVSPMGMRPCSIIRRIFVLWFYIISMANTYIEITLRFFLQGVLSIKRWQMLAFSMAFAIISVICVLSYKMKLSVGL